MGNNIFQKSKVQRSTSVVVPTLLWHHLFSRVTGIADFVISKFEFDNIIIFPVKSFQNICDLFRKAVISPLNCRLVSICDILDHQDTYVILLRVRTYSPHNLAERYEDLGCLYMVVTVLSHWFLLSFCNTDFHITFLPFRKKIRHINFLKRPVLQQKPCVFVGVIKMLTCV